MLDPQSENEIESFLWIALLFYFCGLIFLVQGIINHIDMYIFYSFLFFIVSGKYFLKFFKVDKYD